MVIGWWANPLPTAGAMLPESPHPDPLLQGEGNTARQEIQSNPSPSLSPTWREGLRRDGDICYADEREHCPAVFAKKPRNFSCNPSLKRFCGTNLAIYLERNTTPASMLGITSQRWTTADKYLGNLYQPLSLNRYLYCEDDPVNGVDPSGYWRWFGAIVWGAMGAFTGAIGGFFTANPVVGIPVMALVGGTAGFIAGGLEEKDLIPLSIYLKKAIDPVADSAIRGPGMP